MATAKKIVPDPRPYEVELRLSQEEAETLLSLCMDIGGCPRSSRRRYTASISQALRDVQVKQAHARLALNGLKGFIEIIG